MSQRPHRKLETLDEVIIHMEDKEESLLDADIATLRKALIICSRKYESTKLTISNNYRPIILSALESRRTEAQEHSNQIALWLSLFIALVAALAAMLQVILAWAGC